MTCQTAARSVLGHTEGWPDVRPSDADDASLALLQRRGIAERRPASHPAAGSTVILPLRPGQAWPVVAVHEGLSPESRRLRYSAPTPRLSPRMVRVLTDLRPGQHEAYAAWRGGRPIGIVRWIRIPDQPDAAELALEVVDAEQDRGVGRTLAAFAAVQAWGAGVSTILMSVDPDNGPVHRWLTKRHARALPDDADRFCLPTQALFTRPLGVSATNHQTPPGQPQRLIGMVVGLRSMDGGRLGYAAGDAQHMGDARGLAAAAISTPERFPSPRR